jgi:segregation and condensation protein B
MMEISNLIPHIEALIFASEKPLTTLEITDLINNAFGFMEDKITLDQIESAIEGILEKYKAEFYPFEVRESGGGWQFLTKKDYHKTVGQLNGDKFLKRLSTAALETLSIIAYKQPVTKGEIEAIRGVSSDYAIQKLLEKDLIVITGRNENLPGHPLVYATSKNFMDYFGLNSPEDLPKLKEVFDDTMVAPTAINEGNTPDTTDATAEHGLNGVSLNGTELEIDASEGGDEATAGITSAAADEAVASDDLAEEAGSEEETADEELSDEEYNALIDEALVQEEAEALDEEADEVLDEIADDEMYEEGGEEEELYDEEGEEFEEEEGYEAEEGADDTYITPEEDEETYTDEDDDGVSFKVGENGELIEEHDHAEEEEEESEEENEEGNDDEEEPGEGPDDHPGNDKK